jgi:ribosomal protein L32
MYVPEYKKAIGRKGKIKTIKRMRREAVTVVCPKCGRERKTFSNDICMCFFCGGHIRVKSSWHD